LIDESSFFPLKICALLLILFPQELLQYYYMVSTTAQLCIAEGLYETVDDETSFKKEPFAVPVPRPRQFICTARYGTYCKKNIIVAATTKIPFENKFSR
jgi:hypothetical protein